VLEKEDREKGRGRRKSRRNVRKYLSVIWWKETEGSIHISQRQFESQV